MADMLSADVSTGDGATADQYNNLRGDIVKTFATVASDVLKNSNNDARSLISTQTPTKLKEIKINAAFDGTMRIKFDLLSVSGESVNARLYKNGVAWGQLRNTSSQTWVTQSEDLTVTLAPNDLIQIYAYNDSAEGTVSVSNLRLYYSDQLLTLGEDTLETVILVAKAAISTTNQDP